MAAPVVTLRPRRGGDLQLLRAAAEKCDIFQSLQDSDTEGEVLPIELDFEPALLRCAAERIDELHLATERGEAAEARRRACAAALNEAALPELMTVVAWLGHEELTVVVQEKFASLLEGLGTPAVIRAHFNITADLTKEEEAAAATAPLLLKATTPLLLAPALGAPPAPPAPTRSLSTRAGTDDAAEACLGRCGGATLRAMLGISREWAQRARNVAARADWLEAAVVCGEGEARTAEIGWALAHADDLQELLRRLPVVARLRAGGEEAELGPLLIAQVLDRQLLDAAVPGGAGRLRLAAALYAVMKSTTLTTIGDSAFSRCPSLASISLPEGLTTIGNGAFSGCATLDSATTQRVRAINAAAI